MKMYAALKSIASYVPKNQVTNFDLEKQIDTSHEWIVERTGISSRFFASKDENTSDLAVKAGKIAIQRAGLKHQDIDMVIVATLSPDYLTMPSTACLVAAKLGIINKPAFDISTACTGFIYLLSIAKAFIESGGYNNILIIGAEKISSILDFSDRTTCVLFGDGAGAAIVGRTNEKKKSILDVHIAADGNYSNLLCTPRNTLQDQAKQFLQMKGNEVFKLAVKTLASDVENILQKNHITPQEIKYFIPHQANLRIINAVGNRLNFQDEQIVLTVQKYGNTSAASIPMAINDVYESGKLDSGDLILLDAFGGGLTWGSALVYFDGRR
ncbi:beta-ketoacyl-ACP synthase III [Helicobacter anatolicus]|uniref:beta-ketoacyl-ACP synthase III n=1 Tax=Helicobacter anatolicus TaxID=2905874 RepID=UPI001E3B8538|nr:beta-ketoacyl-ACP synthase III [Helicobacter anatolicus]MCE3038087.1 ketoacyl-ACP synthase III [Helicobacter anatolicus]